MPDPNKIIAKVLRERITAHGPIIDMDVEAVTTAIIKAVREARKGEPARSSKPDPVPKHLIARTSEAADALEQCETILGMCDEMPERGEEFAGSVREKTESILVWIEENGHATKAQQDALNNMESGLGRWLQ